MLDLSANLSPVERILIADWLDQLREDPYACGTLKVGTKSTFVTPQALKVDYRVGRAPPTDDRRSDRPARTAEQSSHGQGQTAKPGFYG